MGGKSRGQNLVYETKLRNEASLLDQLWCRLLITEWRAESVTVLGRLVRSMRQTARLHSDGRLWALTCQLEDSLENWIRVGAPSVEARRGFQSVLNNLQRLLTGAESGVGGATDVNRDLKADGDKLAVTRGPDLYVISPSGDEPLDTTLREAGFPVRRFENVGAAELAMGQQVPLAVIACPGSSVSGSVDIASLGRLLEGAGFPVPLFFLAEQDDFALRLAAAQAGSRGFFVKPVSYSRLLERLKAQLERGSELTCYRALIAHDTPADAHQLADALTEYGCTTRVVIDPERIISEVQDFRPELLVVDLDQAALEGQVLIRLLRQHEACASLPVIALTDSSRLSRYRSVTDLEADDLIVKPAPPEQVHWLARRRLGQARALRGRFDALSRRESVSGLDNRRYFLSQLEGSLRASQADAGPVAVMLIMLENWRTIREETDANGADAVIRQVGLCLQRTLGHGCKLARFGDAIFAVLLTGVAQERLAQIACSARAALHDLSFKPGSRTPGVRACVGVSVAQPGEHDYLTLIRHADLACSLAREAEGVGVHIHNAEVDRQFKASRRNYLREQVGEALLHGRLSLMFQPIVSLRNSRSERYEVLLRLYDQEGRELLPESVFDVVEQHALGARLDGWVISQSLRMLEAPAQRDRPKTLFINLSPATLQSRAMRLWLRERLERAGVDRKQLVFEVSEETARRHLHQLRSFIADFADLGCGFSLERFGRRSDSLSLLERLDVNYVKLASHFVEDLKGQRADHVKGLLRKLVDRLSAREVTIIMVGIEEMAPLTALWSCGVDCVQGFFLQRPQEEMSYDFSGQSG